MKVTKRGIERKRAVDVQVARKRITEQVLMERLSLDEEWLDAENIQVHFHQQLPPELRRQKSSIQIREIEKHVDELVALGCHRGVVYWCLERLTREQDDLRLRGTPNYVVRQADGSLRRPPGRRLATREDMSSLISQLGSVLRKLKRYDRELLFVAEAFKEDFPLPEPFLTGDGPGDYVEAFTLLESSIAWARRLAENWAAPQLPTVMKSKGTLYLLTYLSLCATPDHHAMARIKRNNPGASRTRSRLLGLPQAIGASQLLAACIKLEINADNLIAKLREFRADHPTLFERMTSLMEHLHEAAQS